MHVFGSLLNAVAVCVSYNLMHLFIRPFAIVFYMIIKHLNNKKKTSSV